MDHAQHIGDLSLKDPFVLASLGTEGKASPEKKSIRSKPIASRNN